MNLENFIQSKRDQAHKAIYDPIHMKYPGKANLLYTIER